MKQSLSFRFGSSILACCLRSGHFVLKKVSKSVSLLLGIASVSIFAGSFTAQAATIRAASCSYADVANAVTLAQNGDTVQVPAGGAVWTSVIFIRKPISIIGAGPNATFLTNQIPIASPWSPGLAAPPFFSVQLTNGNSFRVSGFYLYCPPDNNLNGVSIYAQPSQGFNPVNSFRVDHCVFQNTQVPIQQWERANGVVDHNTIIDCSYLGKCVRDGEEEWTRFAQPYVGLGSTNTIVFEDNFLTSTRGYSTFGVSAVFAAHYVFRYNIVTNGGFPDAFVDVLDCHGNGSFAANDRGTIFVEVYNNKFYPSPKAYRVMRLRGGTCMVYSNQIFGVSLDNANIEIDEEETWTDNPTSDATGVLTTWPRQDQITNSHFWANTFNGANFTCPIEEPGGMQPNAPNWFKVERDYFLHAPNATNTLKNYAPLPHPHPLVALQDGSTNGTGVTNILINPVISVSPPTLNFGAALINSTNDLVLSVTNTGGGTLSGTASVSAPFSIVGSPAYALTSGAGKAITIRYLPTAAGTDNQIVAFTGGGGASVSVNGSASAFLAITSMNAGDGAISGPFSVSTDGSVSQTVWSTDVNSGGRAAYAFDLPDAGNYLVSVTVSAPDDSANSFFVNIDDEPSSPIHVWSIPVSDAFTDRVVTWVLNGTSFQHLWFLQAGSHQLIIRGREGNTVLKKATIWKYTLPVNRLLSPSLYPLTYSP
jgi:hypothetical protein